MSSVNIKSTLFLLCLTTLISFLIYSYIKMKIKLNYWKRRGVKHLKGKLFVGNMALISKISMAERCENLYKEFPDEKYFGFYQFMIPTLMIKDPDLIKQISIKDFDHFVDHQDFPDSDFDPFLSRTLFAARGQRWRDLRVTLSPSFTANKLKIMFGLIDDCCQKFVKYFQEQDQDLIEVNVKDVCSRFTNDVIASTSFGITCDSLRDRNNDFYVIGRKVTDFTGARIINFIVYMISPTLCRMVGLRAVPLKVANYFGDMIKEAVAFREKNNIIRPDMLHLLMEAMKENLNQDEELQQDENFSKLLKSGVKTKITIDEIISQAISFFVAGFDTVSTFIMYAFYELAVHPDIQNKLRQEILDTDKETGAKITYNKLLSMKYLDMVASETLRLWPPTLATNRKVTKTIYLEGPGMDPILLEEGTICWIPTIGLHRDPKYFPDPKRFDPERFSEKNRNKIYGGAYMPFGFGPRSCIGNRFALLESKLLIYYVLKHFEIVPVEKTLVPIVLDPNDFSMNPKGGMWLGFKKISVT